MIIKKNSSMLISLLLGVMVTTVASYTEYKDETNSSQTENTQSKSHDETYNPALLQSLSNMEIDMDTRTEVSLNNVQNISHNQLLDEYTSIEHENKQEHHHVDMAKTIEEYDKNTFVQTTKQSIRENLKQEDYETEIPVNKKNRTSRLFTTTTTTIPQYIRRIDEETQILTQKDINGSSSDYEEDEIMEHMQKHTTKMPFNKNLDNSSEENDDIVSLAMKYYDEISPENAFSGSHIEKVNSEDYYEDEYHEPESTTMPLYNNILNSVSADISTSTTEATTTTTTAATLNTLKTTLDGKIPIISQFDSSLLTTLGPLLPLPSLQPQMQTILDTTTTALTGIAAGAAGAIPDKKGKQIPIISTSPVVTTTTISSRRRLLPNEQLRNYIEDAYIRMPLAVIVDPSAESLEKTKTLWNDALRANLNIKIVLVTLNESHESPAAFNFNNTRQFLTGLNSIKEQTSGDAFRGISLAAELVPYDSAVFMSTAQLAKHTDQVQDSAITLLKKRIRLYLIWFGERSLSENETQDSVGGILGDVAIRSGGEILHIVCSDNSQELEGSTLTIVADALRGSHEVDVPVDTTLSSLHVKIDKLMRRAVLETPNGEINLKKLVKFKTQTLTTFDDEDQRLDAYVPLTKLRKATLYKLKVTPEDLTTEYSVFIRGERKADTLLDDMIKHFEAYSVDRHTYYPVRARSLTLQKRLTSNENDAALPTHSKIQFPSDDNRSWPKTEVEIFSTEEVHQNTMNNEQNNMSSLAITTAQQRNSNNLFATNTKIEMGIHSQILIAPGTMGQLYFEVTNVGFEANYYNIQVVDERRYLIRLTPQSLFLRPGQMATVTVSVSVPQNTQGNTIDHITFATTTSGTTTATNSLTVNLKVITAIDAQDNTPPWISWTFGGRCEDVSIEFDSCSERFWSMYITAQDWHTGIMRLQATPSPGLLYTKPYTVGTTEPLKAIYVASCCESKVSLVAFDAAGNQRSHIIDVRDLVLTEASIAAIVLGVILLILLIILLIAAIVWCCRRRKIVLDLPTYRSHSTRSME